MSSVHIYDMLWYNLAKNNFKNQLGLLFSSTNHVSDEDISAQALVDAQQLCSRLHFCRLEATIPNEGGNITEIQPLPLNLHTNPTQMALPL